MFKAIRRWWRVYILRKTGQIDEDRKKRMKDPYVATAIFDESIEERVSKLQMAKRAVSSTVGQQESIIARVKAKAEEIKTKERHRAGAEVLLKRLGAKLKKEGKTPDQIREDAEVKKLAAALRDSTSTLKTLQDEVDAYGKQIEEYEKSIAEQKISLQQALRDLEKLKTEKNDTIADMIIANQRKEVADIMSGLAEDQHAKELQDLREMRRNLVAEARISEELAGISNKTLERELEQAAQDAVTDEEVDKLLGLKEEKPEETAPVVEEEPVGEKSSGVLPGAGSK